MGGEKTHLVRVVVDVADIEIQDSFARGHSSGSVVVSSLRLKKITRRSWLQCRWVLPWRLGLSPILVAPFRQVSLRMGDGCGPMD